MRNFVLSLHSGVDDHHNVFLLKRFVDAALQAGHEIDCIFLYQDGVYHANQNIQLASDEFPLVETWQSLHALNIPILLCVTAAEKRGIDIDDTGSFKVAGLAEFSMLAAKADKWVQFK